MAALIQVPTANITGALSNKRPEIKIWCQSFHCDIFCVTET